MRLVQFDAVKLFAIYMVIFGHCIQHLLGSDHIDEPGYIMIYSFHMPLFMMISGYFVSSSLKRGFMSSIATKARQLLLPFVSSSLAMTIGLCIFTGSDFWKELDSSFTFCFWFLKTTFLCFLLARIAYSFGKHKILAFIITLIYSQTQFIPFSIHFLHINTLYPCFLVGILLKEHWNKVQAKAKTITTITGILFFTMLLFWSKEFWQPSSSNNFYLIYLKLYKIVIGISGSIFFITLFHQYLKGCKNETIKKICQYGEYTIGVYILQTFILETIMCRYVNFDNVNCWVFNLAIAPALSVVILALCIYLSKKLNNNKYTAFLFLGKKL